MFRNRYLTIHETRDAKARTMSILMSNQLPSRPLSPGDLYVQRSEVHRERQAGREESK